jgi:uncharacterized membrane protein
MHQAYTTKNLAIIHHTWKALIRSDQYFTIPGVIVITAAGIIGAIQAHYPLLRTGWIFWAIVLFSFSGVVFGWILYPLQKRLRQLTELKGINEPAFDWTTYNRMYKRWEIWGLVALAAPILALVMMVMKWPVGSIF